MKRLSLPALLLGVLMATGCAGSIFSHKAYTLQAGMVIEASPRRVVTQWPKNNWYWNGSSFGDNYLIVGEMRTRVCPATVPNVGLHFRRANVVWDKAAKCWRWESQ